jgi:hypothetical protein
VIPVVLYHGSAKWRIPLNFASLYQAPESLMKGLVDFTYSLCDLSTCADEEIKLGAMTTVALLLLKHIHSEDLVERLRDVFGLLRAMTEQTALEFLETILRYLGAATQSVTAEDCRRAVEAALPEKGDKYMDRILDELVAERRQELIQHAMKEGIREGMQQGIREGVQQGIREGMQQGIREGVQQGIREGMQQGIREGAFFLTMRLLTRKFGDLDTALEERVRQLSLEELGRLGEELLDFPNESALIEWLDRIEKSR